MFQNASSFNQLLNNWNVSKVTNMERMFHVFHPSHWGISFTRWKKSESE